MAKLFTVVTVKWSLYPPTISPERAAVIGSAYLQLLCSRFFKRVATATGRSLGGF